MNTAEKYVFEQLLQLADAEYKAFHSKLIPNVPPERIIGVRTPQLRKFAREFACSPLRGEFMRQLPHSCYEADNLHGMLIMQLKDYDAVIDELERFLPFIDNWATCDLLRPKMFAKNTDKLLPKIEKWLASDHEYTARFAIEMLMCFYLDEHFNPKHLDWVQIPSEKYYIKMMIAWYFATALALQRDAVMPYFERGLDDKWVHNKAIQKSIESYRISDEDKRYLKTLRQK